MHDEVEVASFVRREEKKVATGDSSLALLSPFSLHAGEICLGCSGLANGVSISPYKQERPLKLGPGWIQGAGLVKEGDDDDVQDNPMGRIMSTAATIKISTEVGGEISNATLDPRTTNANLVCHLLLILNSKGFKEPSTNSI